MADGRRLMAGDIGTGPKAQGPRHRAQGPKGIDFEKADGNQIHCPVKIRNPK